VTASWATASRAGQSSAIRPRAHTEFKSLHDNYRAGFLRLTQRFEDHARGYWLTRKALTAHCYLLIARSLPESLDDLFNGKFDICRDSQNREKRALRFIGDRFMHDRKRIKPG
jgi:hypothetical protein